MVFSKDTGRRERVGWLVCTLALAAIVSVMVLPGCDTVQPPNGAPNGAVDTTGDVCICASGDNADKADLPAEMSKDGTDKARLAIANYWRWDTVPEGTWERHRIQTKAGYFYVVEVCSGAEGSTDDADLYLSRDEDPYNNPWRSSEEADPMPDAIAFEANQTGRMYVGVYGFDGGDDETTEYFIRVRQRLNPRTH